MAFIEWKPQNATGVPLLDEQHQKLFALLNKLHFTVSNRQAKNSIVEVFEGLIDYIIYHFEMEERLFGRFGSPNHERNKTEHDKLTRRLLAMQEDYQEGRSGFSVELLDFLHDWLMNHTTGIDMEFGRFLQNSGVRFPSGA